MSSHKINYTSVEESEGFITISDGIAVVLRNVTGCYSCLPQTTASKVLEDIRRYGWERTSDSPLPWNGNIGIRKTADP